MKNSRKGLAMAAGILIGCTLSGPTVRAAEQIIAQRSVQGIYVDGKSIQLKRTTSTARTM